MAMSSRAGKYQQNLDEGTLSSQIESLVLEAPTATALSDGRQTRVTGRCERVRSVFAGELTSRPPSAQASVLFGGSFTPTRLAPSLHDVRP